MSLPVSHRPTPLTPPSSAWQAGVAWLVQSLRQPPLWLRLAACVAALVLVAAVLWHGAQPYAVGAVRAGWDKLAHAALHFVLCWLLLAGLGLRRSMWAVLACIAFASLDEFAQQFNPGRSVSVADVVASAIGALFALTTARALEWLSEMRGLVRAHQQRQWRDFWLRR